MEVLEVESEEESLVGHTIAAKFRLEKLLGSGSMGRVYRGRHLQLEQTVALKVMSREFASEKTFVARFEREAKASFAVAHPNIIRVIDFGREPNGLIYLAMEYVSGGDLAGLIFRSSPLPTARTVDLMRQALAGIAAAHDAGVIHRDLKPENIMLADTIGDDGAPTNIVKVCDFGIAQLTDAHPSSQRVETGKRRLTQVGLIIGTPEYMAPEQAQGEKVDERSDIYAMGMVLYEMMTGTLPFVAATATEMVMKQISAQPIPPSQRRSSVDPRLEQICMQALAKRPEERFQTARQMRAALGGVIGLRESSEELPPLMQPPPPPKRVVAETLASKGAGPRNAATLVTSEKPAPIPSQQAPPAPSRMRTYASAAVLVLAAGATGAFLSSRTSSSPVDEASARAAQAAPTARQDTPVATAPAAPAAPEPSIAAAPVPSAGAPPSAGVAASARPLAAPPVPPLLAPRPGKGSALAAAAPATTPVLTSATPASTPSAIPDPPAPVAPPPVVSAAPAPTPVATPAPPPPAAVHAIDPNSARAVVTGVSNVVGALRRDVEGAISRPASHFVGCYQADLGASAAPPTGAGVLHVETDDTGTITSAHATVPLSASGARCLERAVMRVRIPNVDTGQAQADIGLSFDVR